MIKYEFECGCIRKDFAQARTKAGGHIKVCPEHGGKVSAKHVQCCAEGCNKMLRIHPMGNVTNRRCKPCLKLQIKARNKTYGGAWRHKGTYGTSDEIFFFDTLPAQKKRRYFELMPLRNDWGDIDPKLVKKHCQQELRGMGGY